MPTGRRWKAFTIQLSTDGATWSTPVSVANNTAGVTTHPIAATSARYARLNVTAPTQGTDPAARIYEFEVYGS
ncbi:MAG TPA: discoidin domain-containing protein [Actinokineospora sp.]|nr:discoidin domain-containing protein [Actinokineospora sp.]